MRKKTTADVIIREEVAKKYGPISLMRGVKHATLGGPFTID